MLFGIRIYTWFNFNKLFIKSPFILKHALAAQTKQKIETNWHIKDSKSLPHP